LRKKADYCERLAARFRRVSGDNVLKRIIDAKAADCRRNIANHEKAGEVVALAMEIVSGHEFTIEPMTSPMQAAMMQAAMMNSAMFQARSAYTTGLNPFGF
jgi:hypothetical protein